MHKIVPGYPPTQEACARVLIYGHCSVAATNTATRRCVHTDTRVCTHTAAHMWHFKDSVTCCATQSLGLQFVTPCTEEA